jgi:inner membrane protein
MAKQQSYNIVESVKRSHLIRILLIGFLILLLQIPIAMIRGAINEREHRRLEATNEVTAKWGEKQSFKGPVIVIPYTKRWSEAYIDGKHQIRTKIQYAHFLPEQLHIAGRIDSDVRYRGIFKIPVYRMSLTMKGQFKRPDFSEWGIASKDIFWDRAHLSIRISDARAITKQVLLSWNGKELDFLPGSGESTENRPGIHTPLKARLEGRTFDFSLPLELNGSVGVFFVPFGRETKVVLESDWPDPSFQGGWLPTQRSINNDGFQATWSIPFLSRNYPQQWTSESETEEMISLSQFGVNLVSPIDHYRMAHRSIKYAALFLVLTFVMLWLFEIRNNMRIHPLQYLLLGAGMCLFYLLELSISEHIGFLASYMIASAAIVGLAFSYSITVLQSAKQATIVGTVFVLLYAYLYVLLRNQDYALLLGSIGLFLIVATIMYLTRKVNWYSPKKQSSRAKTKGRG